MTKSCVTHLGRQRDPERGAALALQGGGVHGAFAWGVLDRLPKKGFDDHAVCGVPYGASVGVTPRARAACPMGGTAPRGDACTVRTLRPGNAERLAWNLDRARVIQLTSLPAVCGYHCLVSCTPPAHRVVAKNPAQPNLVQP
jgi:hypothetical protein